MAKPQVLSPIQSNIAKSRFGTTKSNQIVANMKIEQPSSSSSSSYSSSAHTQRKTRNDGYHADQFSHRERILSNASLSSSDQDDEHQDEEEEEGLVDVDDVRKQQGASSKTSKTLNGRVPKKLQRNTINNNNHNNNSSSSNPINPTGKRTRHAFVEIFSPVRAMRVARAGMKRKHGSGQNQNQLRGGVLKEGNNNLFSTTKVQNQTNHRGRLLPANKAEGLSSTALRGDIGKGHPFLDEPESIDPLEHRNIPLRPRHQVREASSSSLRRNMRAMRLSDQDEMDQDRPVNTSRRSSTRSVTRLASNGMGSRKASTSSSRGSRSRRLSMADITGEVSHGDVEDAQDEGERIRLLQQAPSWQLRRLTKDKLFELHVCLGTFNSDETIEMDSFNKQDLVDGIIQSRSQDEPPTSVGSNLDTNNKASVLSSSSSFSERKSSKTHSSAVPSLKRSGTNNSIVSRSSDYTDDEEEEQSASDANDAAGEETEVEPVKADRRKKFTSPQTFGANKQGTLRGPVNNAFAFPMHKDNSNEGSSTRSSSIISPARRRLRHKGSLVFAASSPIRTRARTRHQSSASAVTIQPLRNNSTPFGQRTLRANNQGELMLDTTVVTPKMKRVNRRGPGNVARFQLSARETDDGDESNSPSELENDAQQNDEEEMEDWEDTSPTVSRKRTLRTPRKAKVRAQEQLHQTLEEDSEAMVENVLNGVDEGDESEGMSLDETISDIKIKQSRLLSSRLSPPLSEMSLDESENGNVSEELDSDESELSSEDEGHDRPSDIDASPSKIRKLRNGKVRLPTMFNESGIPAFAIRNESSQKVHSNDKPKIIEMDEREGQDFSHSALNRLKRDRLIELCEQEGVLHAKDATRAILIDALLAHHGNNRDDIASSHTEKPDSTSSNRTARPGSSDPNAKKTKGSRETVTESDKPLLLRTRSLRKESHSKPGTPIPSQNEEDLNGLDLESLQLVDKEIAFNKLEKLDKIGSGGFKDVYVGKYHITKKTTRKVAIADIRDQLSEMDIKELTLLRDLKHENIVRFIGVCIPPVEMRLTPCMIVSELCANGDLYDYIRNTEPPPDEEIFRILLETARGLEYLHLSSPAIIHRDVKSTNVLITRNKTAKINDFGLARVRNNKRSMIKSLVGTVNWQAVELWCPKPNYNEKVDVWSAGMTFWEALQWHQPEKKYPFQDMNEHQIYQDVGQKKLRPSTVSIRRRYGSEIVELLDRMWDHNPKVRPTMTEVCEEMENLVQMKKEAAAASAESDSKDKKYKTNNTTRNASR